MSFSLNLHVIERTVYILIIIALGILLFMNPFGTCLLKNNDVTNTPAVNKQLTGAATTFVQQPNTTTPTIETKNQTTQIIVTSTASQTTQNVTPQQTTTANNSQQVEPEKPFIINFDFNIENVDFTRNTETKWPSKIRTITFSMWNRWKTFDARVEVYWYDKDSSDVFKEKKRATVSAHSTKGKMETFIIDAFESSYFDPTNKAETIELKLFNEETNELLTSETYIIN